MQRIDGDSKRFKEKQKQILKKSLGRFLEKTPVRGPDGNVIYTDRRITIPRFIHGTDEEGGGLQMPGANPHNPLDLDEGMTTDFPLEELVDLFFEEWEIPDLVLNNKEGIKDIKTKYTDISNQGPNSLRHPRRTMRQALKRQIASGSYSPGNPIIPRREEYRYRAPQTIVEDIADLQMNFLLDVSGSVTEEQKEFVRIETFWLKKFLAHQYGKALGKESLNVDICYFLHTDEAKKVTENQFYTADPEGGTDFSNAYKTLLDHIQDSKRKGVNNIVLFQYTDGEIFDYDDMAKTPDLFADIMAEVNLVGYTQVNGRAGDLWKMIKERFGWRLDHSLRMTYIKDYSLQAKEHSLKVKMGAEPSDK